MDDKPDARMLARIDPELLPRDSAAAPVDIRVRATNGSKACRAEGKAPSARRLPLVVDEDLRTGRQKQC